MEIAPGSPRLDAGRGARGAIGLLAWAFFLAKAASLGLILADEASVAAVLAFTGGFAADLLVVTIAGVLGLLLARGLRGRGLLSALGGGLWLLLAVVVSLFAVADIYAVMCFGSPLTYRMLSYKMGVANAAALAGDAPVRTTIALVVAWAVLAPVAAIAADRLLSWKRLRVGAAVAAGYVVLALLSRFAWPDVVAAYGLDRNGVTSIVGTTLRAKLFDESAATGPVVPYDAPLDPPREASYIAPVPWERSAPRPKHVVVWLSESFGARYAQLYGAKEETTPNLMRLKDHSLRFERYYANQPISIQAIFGVLCGMYPYPDNKFITILNPRIACPSLMETLTARGYDAALFHGGIFGFTDKLKFLGERGFDVMLDAENMPNRADWYTNGWGIDDAAMIDNGTKWLDGRADKTRPTLSVYIPLFPHYDYFLPPKAPRPFGEKSEMDKYRNGLRYTDQLFGRLYDDYVKRGLADDTLFVFLGDHGEAFGQHPRNKLHGSFAYEENVHAPLVFINSRLFPKETVSKRLGSHVDLMATLLDLIDVPKPAGTQGQSLVSSDYKYRPVLLGAYWQDKISALRDGKWKLVHDATTGVDELFDLDKDPGEKANLATSRPDLVADYTARLNDFEKRQKELIEKHPRLGDSYMKRVLAKVEMRIEKPDGTVVKCDGKRKDGGLTCPGESPEMFAAVQDLRSFNIARECLRVHTPETGKLVLRIADLAPAPKTVGLGIDDSKRFAQGTPIIARWQVGALPPFALQVADKFEDNFRGRALADQPAGAPTTITIELESANWQNRTACLSFAP